MPLLGSVQLGSATLAPSCATRGLSVVNLPTAPHKRKGRPCGGQHCGFWGGVWHVVNTPQFLALFYTLALALCLAKATLYVYPINPLLETIMRSEHQANQALEDAVQAHSPFVGATFTRPAPMRPVRARIGFFSRLLALLAS